MQPSPIHHNQQTKNANFLSARTDLQGNSSPLRVKKTTQNLSSKRANTKYFKQKTKEWLSTEVVRLSHLSCGLQFPLFQVVSTRLAYL